MAGAILVLGVVGAYSVGSKISQDRELAKLAKSCSQALDSADILHQILASEFRAISQNDEKAAANLLGWVAEQKVSYDKASQQCRALAERSR